MVYAIEFSPAAEKTLKKLDTISQKRILSVLERSRIRPHTFAKSLVGSPYFRLRAGDYRIIINIVSNRLIVYVIDIDHRKHIYKK